MPASNDWIKCGDRSHPHLRLIDNELKHMLTYEGHCGDLQRLEDSHLNGDVLEFENILFFIRESQRIHEGNRSHPRLVELDGLRDSLTYTGWEKDFDEAFKIHKTNRRDVVGDFRTCVISMKRKQAMFIGDRSHRHLVVLESLDLSFPGWERDLQDAIDSHMHGVGIDYNRRYLIEKQRMFEGNRSHPRLVALDSLKLTYPGWRKDIQEAEEDHIEAMRYTSESVGLFQPYKAYLQLLLRKQKEYEATKSAKWYHPIQRKIVSTKWSYPDWQADINLVEAEKSVCYNADYTFKDWLEKCSLKQMIHDGDFRSHPALRKLDMLKLSYPGWESDFECATNFLRNDGLWTYDFDLCLGGMKNKQTIYEGAKIAEDSKVEEDTPKYFGKCIFCLESPRTHIFVPCGHACACKSCSDKVMAKKKKCPVCNQSFEMSMEFFFP